MSDYDKKIQQWRDKGFCVVSGLIEPTLMEKCTKLLQDRWDTTEKCGKDFGSNGEFEFPCGAITDHLTVDENLISFVRKLLQTEDITLTQSDAWSKAGQPASLSYETTAQNEIITSTYSKTAAFREIKAKMSQEYWGKHGNIYSNQDQRIHMDYGNHTFLHPREWHTPDTVAAIVYFHDTSKCGGGTAVVPRSGDDDPLYKPPYTNMPGYGGFQFFNSKAAAEDYFRSSNPEVAMFREHLYEREVIPHYKQGDILFYRLDTWHRGTPLKEGGIRAVQSLAWRRTDCPWYNTWNPGLSRKMYYGPIEKFFAEISPSQRASIGVPLPGHSYWTHYTIEMLKARYPAIDVQPYLAKLKK